MAVRRPAAEVVGEGAKERLLVEAARTDPAKFGDLYEIHFERIYAYIAKRVRDRATAEDLTSEVFHKALASMRSYEWRGVSFSAWLIRIAANAVTDQWKRAAQEVLGAEEYSEPDVQPDLGPIEERARLFRFVSQLPDDQRHVIRERFVEQRSIREIAQQLGRTEGAVKQLQFRGLQKLRTQMDSDHA